MIKPLGEKYWEVFVLHPLMTSLKTCVIVVTSYKHQKIKLK